jgi:hypothetical protein
MRPFLLLHVKRVYTQPVGLGKPPYLVMGLQNTSLYFALRAVLRTFKTVPDGFVIGPVPGPIQLLLNTTGWLG